MSRTLVFHIIGAIVLLGALIGLISGGTTLFRAFLNARFGDVVLGSFAEGVALLTGATAATYFVLSTWQEPQPKNEETLLDLPAQHPHLEQLNNYQQISGIVMLVTVLVLLVPLGGILHNLARYIYTPRDITSLICLSLLIICMVAYVANALFVRRKKTTK